jgi:hypothetical protein
MIVADVLQLAEKDPEWWRLVIATYLLGRMLETGGEKAQKVSAAFAYADLLLEGFARRERV